MAFVSRLGASRRIRGGAGRENISDARDESNRQQGVAQASENDAGFDLGGHGASIRAERPKLHTPFAT